MSNIPKPFGFPMWKGVKRRVAKKILARYGRHMFYRLYEFDKFKVGDLICGCIGLNSRVEDVSPVYIMTKNGKVLIDLDFSTDRGGCSMYHCGVIPPISYAQAEAYKKHVIEYWSKHGDTWKFAERYLTYEIQPDGTFKTSQSKETMENHAK